MLLASEPIKRTLFNASSWRSTYAALCFKGRGPPVGVLHPRRTKYHMFMPEPSLPVELWIRIFRLATRDAIAPDMDVPLQSPFDIQRQKHLRHFDSDYSESMHTKTSMSLVCRSWRMLVYPLLWETLFIKPGRKFHQIGAILQQDQRRTSKFGSQAEKPIGHFIRALHVAEGSSRHELFDFANIERIVRCCPNLVTITAPDSWQMYQKDFHISCDPLLSLREISFVLLNEQSIQSLVKTNKNLRVVRGSNIRIQCPPCQDLVLPSVHTVSMRLDDMEVHRLFVPSLRRWVIHDNIDGIEKTHAFQLHANLVTVLELSCEWTDHVRLQQNLSAMANLQDLVIHLSPGSWSPVPHLLPVTMRRLGFSCPLCLHGWILDADQNRFQWFWDHLEDWINVASDGIGHLKTIRFLDWECIQLPSGPIISVRRDAYSLWWRERLQFFEEAGIIIEDQEGKRLRIGT